MVPQSLTASCYTGVTDAKKMHISSLAAVSSFSHLVLHLSLLNNYIATGVIYIMSQPLYDWKRVLLIYLQNFFHSDNTKILTIYCKKKALFLLDSIHCPTEIFCEYFFFLNSWTFIKIIVSLAAAFSNRCYKSLLIQYKHNLTVLTTK